LAGGSITTFGQRLLKLGTHPRLGAMLLAPDDVEDVALACDLAALLEARDPLKGPRRDDIAARWQALAAFRNGRTPPDASRSALAAIDQTAKQWQRRLSTLNPDSPNINAGRIKHPGRGSDTRASDPPLHGLIRPTPTDNGGRHDNTASAHHLGERLIHAFPD